MNALQIGRLLIVFAGAFGSIKHIIFRLPSAIGILIVAFVASLCVLGLLDSDWKSLILTATYIVLVFSIIVHGLNIAPLVRFPRRESAWG